jgi:hypothetical protein
MAFSPRHPTTKRPAGCSVIISVQGSCGVISGSRQRVGMTGPLASDTRIGFGFQRVASSRQLDIVGYVLGVGGGDRNLKSSAACR